METTNHAADSGNLAAWGDSLTAGVGGTPYPLVLTQLTGIPVFNGGVGGETSVQIKDRMVAAADKHAWPTIIWAGRNDSNQPDQVKASIAAMVAALPHTSYLILSILNGEGEGRGTAGYQKVMGLNNDLAALYGNHYLDVRGHLVAQYNPSLPQDVADHNADIPPASLRSDFVHLSTSGYALVANYIAANSTGMLGLDQSQRGGPETLNNPTLVGKVTQVANNNTDSLEEWHADNGNVITLEKDGNALTASGTLYLNGGNTTVLQADRTTAVEITSNALYVKQDIVQQNGDLEFSNAVNGIILKSPNGARYRLTVTDAGSLAVVGL